MSLPQTREEREKLLKELVLLDYEKSERNFAHFFRSAWPVLEPNTQLLYNWHHELIAEYLTACYLRQIKRLIINMPPRYSKSNEITVTWPCWVWTKVPEERFLITSYAGGLSTKHSTDRRTLIESRWYQAKWGCRCPELHHDPGCRSFRMATDQNVKSEFANDRRGHMTSTSMSGTATGKGGNILIVDDPHDTTRAESEIKRESDILEFDQKFTTRLDDKKNGVIIIVMQRLNEADLTGHCLKQGGWTHVKLEGEATKKTIVVFPMSKKEVVREEGDALHPEREDKARLEIIRTKELGSYGYSCQYQQSPSPREGGILKRDWWQRYNKLPEKFDQVIDSWDFTFKEGTKNDFVCGTVWGRVQAFYYLLHLFKKQMGFEESLKQMLQMRTKFPEIRKTLIEEKANGAAIIEVAKKKVTGVIAYNPQGSKEERAAAVSPMIESGNVFLPVKDIATFDVEDFIEVCANFPNVAHDDEVDSATQALLYLRKRSEPCFL